ncbi:DUF5011 domain-containing protein [Butyrivibrio sp. INlla16]|uniref:DUF5011 domain-containing protein n=1 Tax=Butyrivibrio sp. INlla16 TaxID=1520807 RepID=UPI0008895D56|nr:DUF5011 domain-containing protein [Butyrivibrio sp. INlla16]SDB09939.1 hypothetical protein SAMN02910263_00442 [Butyrivibrio sp. INlla16]
MKSNILAFFFTIGSIVMAVFIVWFYNMTDRIQPEMRFSSYELTYDENTKEADLLNGVAAYDAVDGDITDRIVVEKTILNEEQETAVVYYAVSDKSGNVTKQSRVFPANIDSIKSNGNVLFSSDQSYNAYPEGVVTDGFNTEGFGTGESETVGN